jgi:hypothetical protein
MRKKAKKVLAVRTLPPKRHQSKGFHTKAEAMPWVQAKHVKAAWIFEGGKTLYKKRKHTHHARSR